MLGQYLVTFREAFEAALILAIMLSYFARSRRNSLSRYVWYGTYLAIATGIGVGASIWFVYGALPAVTETLFEAAASYLAVAVLSLMIYWMATRGEFLRQELEQRVEAIVARGALIGLVAAAFVVVFRECLETVLFLTPFILSDTVGTVIGIVGGVLTAALLGYFVFAAGMRINLRKFFFSTSLLLVLVAGGLAGHGTHELTEYCEEIEVNVGWLGHHAYTLGIPEGSPFHDSGVVGSVLGVMFGYTVSAEWFRIIVHLIYLAVMFPLVVWVYRRIRRASASEPGGASIETRLTSTVSCQKGEESKLRREED